MLLLGRKAQIQVFMELHTCLPYVCVCVFVYDVYDVYVLMNYDMQFNIVIFIV